MGEDMNKKIKYFFLALLVIICFVVMWNLFKKKDMIETEDMTATILTKADGKITLQDKQNVIYTFYTKNIDFAVGENVSIQYSGILNKNSELQEGNIVSYVPAIKKTNEEGIPNFWLDDGIFSDYYMMAYNNLKKMSLDEKIGQLFLVRYPGARAKEDLKKYHLGGYLFFEKDFKNKAKTEVQNMIEELQNASNIPLLTAVDEEGGKVVRISSNPNLVSSPFKSSQELYKLGGFNRIKQDTVTKSKVLSNLGLNLNLAPVVDVSINPNDYIYERSFGKDTELTSTYAKTVIEASREGNVSYTLKHFPGYGNNTDTHIGNSIDNRLLTDIKDNDLPPFKSGINAGAEAILVSHNTVVNIDASNPASLSASIHNFLRNDLGFTGIIMTDDLDMKAVSSTPDVVVKAILAGNDLIITSDYEQGINDIKRAIKDGTISEDLIDKLAFRILAWKYYKGLMYQK